MENFNPNQVSFKQGSENVQEFLKKAKVDIHEQILTSRDKLSERLKEAMQIKNVPRGFKKWQLPFLLEPTQIFITQADPGAKVGRHAHEEGDGLRFITQGSIIYEGKELTAGDWMFIPAGKDYEFEVGPHGAIMGYCYCCSCAGAKDIFDPEIVYNPKH